MKHFDDVFLSIDHEIESPTYEEFKAKYNKYIAHFPEKHLYLRLFDNKDENEMGGSFLFKNKTVLKDNLKALKELGLDNYSLVVPSVKNKDELLFILKQDYLLKNKIKPKIWWERNITREERLEVYKNFSDEFDLNNEQLFRYGHLEKLGSNYFLVNYKTNEHYHLKIKKD